MATDWMLVAVFREEWHEQDAKGGTFPSRTEAGVDGVLRVLKRRQGCICTPIPDHGIFKDARQLRQGCLFHDPEGKGDADQIIFPENEEIAVYTANEVKHGTRC